MGTRNLTMVISKSGETKIAQYGQWDGYPGGVGVGVLKFLQDKESLNKLQENLLKVRFFDSEGKDKSFIDSYSKNAPQWSNEPDNRTKDQIRWFKTYISRDLSDEILDNIADSEDEEILLKDGSDFINDSLMCEWAYVIDFKTSTFEVYEGFIQSKPKKGDRFYSEEPNKSGYYPCQLTKKYDLDNLPSEDEFIEYFKDKD